MILTYVFLGESISILKLISSGIIILGVYINIRAKIYIKEKLLKNKSSELNNSYKKNTA